MNQLGVGDQDAQVAKNAYSKRKLTTDEKNELRKTTLVKKKGKGNTKDVTFDDFDFLMVIGRGTFGKVFLAEFKETKKLYAIKSIRKDILIQYD